MVPARDWSLELSKGDNMKDYVKENPEYMEMVKLHKWNDREMKILGLKPWNNKK